jgi:hypothetical protein
MTTTEVRLGGRREPGHAVACQPASLDEIGLTPPVAIAIDDALDQCGQTVITLSSLSTSLSPMQKGQARERVRLRDAGPGCVRPSRWPVIVFSDAARYL